MSTLASVIVSDVIANRPAAGISGRLFVSTDEGKLYRDNGSSWDNVVTATTPGPNPGMVLLERHVASGSSSLLFTTWPSSTYDKFEVHFDNLLPSVSGVTDIRLLFSTNGGSSYDTSGIYQHQAMFAFSGGVPAEAHATADTGCVLATSIGNTATGGGICARLTLWNPASTTLYKRLEGWLNNYSDGLAGMVISQRSYIYKNATAVNAFKVLPSSGNLASGSVSIYGLTKV